MTPEVFLPIVSSYVADERGMSKTVGYEAELPSVHESKPLHACCQVKAAGVTGHGILAFSESTAPSTSLPAASVTQAAPSGNNISKAPSE